MMKNITLPVMPGDTVWDEHGESHRIDDILLFYPKQNEQVPSERIGVLQMRLSTIDAQGYEEWSDYVDNIGESVFLSPKDVLAARKEG
jgi:hypothetical protein